jgi:glycine/D-amino acid oxidase-like deaminating enzyme
VVHDAYGWWVREAGAPEGLAPLREQIDADVVIVGGGYLGMWTAWHLLERSDSDVSIVLLEKDRCGFGPSGRNGGFVSPYWEKLHQLVEHFGESEGVRLAEASEAAVHAIGDWCSSQDVDAWYRAVNQLELATAANQEGIWEEGVEACARYAPREVYRVVSRADVQSRARSPQFGGGAIVGPTATVQPARLAFGLREKLLSRGVRIFESSPVVRVRDGAGVDVLGGGSVRAPRAVVAVNHVAGGLRPWRRLVSTASSHIVLTAPIAAQLEEIGWTDGTALRDCRTMLHYFRTTNDGRIAFGWGGGRMALGSRRAPVLDVDPDAAARGEASLKKFFPSLRDVPIEHAWGGPIDVSPIKLPQYRVAGSTFAGFGFTGNGVGPSYLGGQILSGMVLDARDEFTSLPLVEPHIPRRFPPEPFRYVGGARIRSAMVRADSDAEDDVLSPLPVRFMAGLPKRLGMSLPR